jgi:hypothetical protein
MLRPRRRRSNSAPPASASTAQHLQPRPRDEMPRWCQISPLRRTGVPAASAQFWPHRVAGGGRELVGDWGSIAAGGGSAVACVNFPLIVVAPFGLIFHFLITAYGLPICGSLVLNFGSLSLKKKGLGPPLGKMLALFLPFKMLTIRGIARAIARRILSLIATLADPR